MMPPFLRGLKPSEHDTPALDVGYLFCNIRRLASLHYMTDLAILVSTYIESSHLHGLPPWEERL
eukprot:15092-Eustigmatos_ZCMA.PRE.1